MRFTKSNTVEQMILDAAIQRGGVRQSVIREEGRGGGLLITSANEQCISLSMHQRTLRLMHRGVRLTHSNDDRSTKNKLEHDRFAKGRRWELIE